MLVPRPPRPVGRRREVAAAVVSHQQPAAIAPGHVVQVRRPPATTDPRQASAAPTLREPAISLRVVYELREYLAILREYLPHRLVAWERSRGKAADGRLSWQARAALALLLPLAGAPVFWRKKRRMPVCRFAIDGDGFERRAGGGRLAFGWNDVSAVHRLRSAYLVDKGDGGLPLPYRCFDAGQRAAFERLLLSRFPQETPV
jgi:YcxB-like protein